MTISGPRGRKVYLAAAFFNKGLIIISIKTTLRGKILRLGLGLGFTASCVNRRALPPEGVAPRTHSNSHLDPQLCTAS